MADENISTPEEPVTLSEPVVEQPDPQLKPQPRRSGLLGALLGGVLAAGAGFGVAQYVPQGWPITDTSALEARLAAQEVEIASLKAALAALPAPDPTLAARLETVTQALAALPPPADTTALSDRLAALEALPTGNGNGPSLADFAAQTEALRSLQTEVAALRASGGTVPANVEALVAEAEQRLKDAETQAATLKAEAEALTKAATSRAALGRVQAALESGAPYASALPDLGLEVPAVLADAADTGIPTLAALQTAFPDAARAALEAALRANMGESWSERVGSFLRSQTGVRSLTPREGTDPDAILSRAEAALAGGDLQTALTELTALPPEAADQMAGWRGLAEQRQAALVAVADLAAKLGE
jgi:hypothetical protein